MIYPIAVKKLTTDQPNGEAVQYFYDFGGLPERVHGNDDALELNYASNIAYDKFGQRLSMIAGNGVVTRLHVQQLQLHVRQGRQSHPAAEHRPAAPQLHPGRPRQRHRRAVAAVLRL